MPTISKLSVILTGNADGLVSVFQKTEKAFERMEDKLGKGTLVDDFGDLFEGKGAVAGLTGLLGAVDAGARKLADLNAQWTSGQISAGEYWEAVAKGVPVIGRFVEAGRSIREFFTGEQAAAEAMERAAQRVDAVADSMRDMGRVTRDWREELERAAREIPNNLYRASVFPFGKVFDAANEYAKRLEEVERGLREKLTGGAIAEAQAKLTKMRQELAAKADAMGGAPLPNEEFKTDSADDDRIRRIEEYRQLEGQIKTLAAQLHSARVDAQGWADRMKDAAFQTAAARAVTDGLSGAMTALSANLRNPTTLLGGLLANVEQKSAPVLNFIQKWGEHFEQIRQDAPRIAQDLIGPFQRYGQELGKLDYLLRNKFLSTDTAGKASGNAFWEGFEKAFQGHNFLTEPLDKFRFNIDLLLAPAKRFFAEYQHRTQETADAEALLRQSVIGRLEAAGALGDHEAEIGAKRLAIEEQIRQKRDALNRIASNNRIPESDRLAAADEIARLPALEEALKQQLAAGFNLPAPGTVAQLSAQYSLNRDSEAAPKLLLKETERQTGILRNIEKGSKPIIKVNTIAN